MGLALIRYATLAYVSSLAVLTGGAAIAEATPDCSSFNSAAFFAAATPEDVTHCLSQGAPLLPSGPPEDPPLFHAVRHATTPLVLDALLRAAKKRDQLDEVLSAPDKLGRSILHVAAVEALDPAIIPWLTKWGADVLAKSNCAEDFFPDCTQPIHLAANRKDNFLFLASLMALGAKIDVRTRHGRTPADLAMFAGEDRWNYLALLDTADWPNKIAPVVNVSPDPTAPCDHFLTPDFFASSSLAQLTHCLNEGFRVVATDQKGNTALHHAAAHAVDPRLIDLLLFRLHQKDPADVKQALQRTNNARMPALHHAARHGTSPEVIVRLLAWGADPNALAEPIERRRMRTDIGTTPLHQAARNKGPGRKAILTVLLAAGASPTLQDHESGGRQALHFLLAHDPVTGPYPDVREVQLLLEAEFARHGYVKRRLDKSVPRQAAVISDRAGATALHVAARYAAKLDVVKTLVDHGFSPDDLDSNSWTPLMLAALYSRDAEAFFLLLKNSKDPCPQRSKEGATVSALLDKNETLKTVVPTGRRITPLEAFRGRCP